MTVFPWPVTTTDEDSDFVTRLPFPPDGFQRAASELMIAQIFGVAALEAKR